MSSKGLRILGIGLVVLLAGTGWLLCLNTSSRTVEAQDQSTNRVQLPRSSMGQVEEELRVEPAVSQL